WRLTLPLTARRTRRGGRQFARISGVTRTRGSWSDSNGCPTRSQARRLAHPPDPRLRRGDLRYLRLTDTAPGVWSRRVERGGRHDLPRFAAFTAFEVPCSTPRSGLFR